jgi:hypothetical protein
MDAHTIFGADAPVVGMVHLSALPGAPGYDPDDRASILEAARRDATRLESGGVDALLVENFGDAPFYAEEVPSHVVADLTAAVGAVREVTDLPIGVNVLRNDAEAALSVAAATEASAIRVNVHTGARVTDQGVIEGRAHETLRHRDRIDAGDVAILADVAVKHSAPLGEPRPTTEAVEELLGRGRADGLVVSGTGTGAPTDRSHLETVVAARDEFGTDAPVFVGSGVTAETVADTLGLADGVIVGTALKAGEETTNPVSEEHVASLVAAADRGR